MLTATALVTDPTGLAQLRAVLATGPGYAARKAAARHDELIAGP